MTQAAAATPRRSRTVRQPMLLVLVYGVFLVLIGGLAVALAVLVGAHFSSVMLGTTAAHDRALVGLWADATVTPAELRGGSLEPARAGELQLALAALAQRGGMLHVELRDPAGRLLLSSASNRPATSTGASEEHQLAAQGTATVKLIEPPQPIATDADLAGPLIQEFLPLVERGGSTVAVVAVWRDAAPMLAQLDAIRRDVLLVVSVIAVVLAVVLMSVFRAAHRRLARQNTALVESTRRDPLTGLLNHGATVATLAERIEVAHSAGAPLAVALLDVDNFRLLNETYGHPAGDAVLHAVADQLGELAPSGLVIGRYGPDEFAIIGPPVATEVVDVLVEQLRERLRGVALKFGESEALPVTVSVGVAHYPAAAKGVTDLLAAAASAIVEARASGGDAVRGMEQAADQPAAHTPFTALQGLVFAVDNKDRYTRRHSEDVARYAVFLGRHLGLPPEALEQLRLAGLLHDVGKVGVPDVILRKPAALSREERQIVEQHVALGDLIVRDLPYLEQVRAGVRYHHERWDGAGYLERKAGEEIPAIARILAVCDTFSAMTTTRPYRKAMSVADALKRLGDAAGTQLDARFVGSFIGAMDTVADAPRPEDESMRVRLWLPAVARG